MSLDIEKSTWKRVALRDVVRHVTDRVDAETSGLDRFLAGEHIPSGSLAITDWGVIGRDPIGPMFYKRFKANHVLYVSRRTYLRKVAVPEFVGITGEKTFVLETLDQGALLQEFLPFVLSSETFHTYAIANSRGSVNPYLNWGELAAYEFDIPPLHEQKRIADLLWAVERHRRALGQKVCATLDARRAHFLSLKASTRSTKRLADVATIRNGQGFPVRLQGRPDGDYPFFKVSDLDSPGNERLLTSTPNWITSEDAAGMGARLAEPGDVVTVRTGAALNAERRRIVAEPCLVDDHFLIVHPTKVDTDFLWAWLSEVKLSDSRNEGVVPSINQKILGAVELPDLEADGQHRFAHAYGSMTLAATSLKLEIQSLDAIKSAILQKVFE
ncbi:hypothetical protein GCM10009630_46870 [Kribbella jejuensis]|uniref:Restriction endonuclease S subunit n=1 Tax=Kribbella jejuensis TaxID=236068 RepID=A0A542EWL4_9ACTN|nr:restriction endonuclease subunit S [Kribbella jejuensis]TQJ19742.1 restriction endonuclease S subunit [Kribbella jejuensis]